MTSLDQSHLQGAFTAAIDRTKYWKVLRVLIAVLLTALCLYLTRDPWAKMFAISVGDEESSHVLLAPLAMLWLVVTRRHLLKGCTGQHTWAGPLVVGLGWASLIYGYDINDNEFWFFGAILMALGCVLSFVGGKVFIRLLPAFAVLLFLIPVPGFFRIWISMPLQKVMAVLTQHLGDLFGFIIDRNGNTLVVNGTPIEIAEACNGMRMVFTLLLVGYTVAFATPLRWHVRLAVILLAPVFALICNLLRMLPTVWMYGNAPHNWADAFHDASGWVMILVGYFLLMGSISFAEWLGIPVLQKRQTGDVVP